MKKLFLLYAIFILAAIPNIAQDTIRVPLNYPTIQAGIVGRGPGSGLGKTAGRGEKGQKSRSGFARKPGFEGGQMPLHRRIPKRGFSNYPFKKAYATVNLGRLEVFEAGPIVTPELLVKQGIVKKLLDGLKVLADGQLTKALTVHAHRFSGKAQERIATLGGKAELIQG